MRRSTRAHPYRYAKKPPSGRQKDWNSPDRYAQMHRREMYNLTENQKELISELVRLIREGSLNENFTVHRDGKGGVFVHNLREKTGFHFSNTETQAFDALARAQLLIVDVLEPRFGLLNCTLRGEAYAAVDSNFAAPDTSFLKQLTPLADLTSLDRSLKDRCLPILGAGAADPALWDSAVRTAGVILEERLRDVGQIKDANVIGRDLVNKVFGTAGTLACKFALPAERAGYRDLFAGIVGVIRNPSAHRLVDPTPEEGGATVVFVNLLLKKLEALR